MRKIAIIIIFIHSVFICGAYSPYKYVSDEKEMQERFENQMKLMKHLIKHCEDKNYCNPLGYIWNASDKPVELDNTKLRLRAWNDGEEHWIFLKFMVYISGLSLKESDLWNMYISLSDIQELVDFYDSLTINYYVILQYYNIYTLWDYQTSIQSRLMYNNNFYDFMRKNNLKWHSKEEVDNIIKNYPDIPYSRYILLEEKIYDTLCSIEGILKCNYDESETE